MLKRGLRLPAELAFTGGLVALLAGVSVAFRLPIRLPNVGAAEFLSLHYFLPMAGLAVWGLCAMSGQRRRLRTTFLVGLPCYAVVMVAHFNLKLWAPLIHPVSYDAAFWAIDQQMRPLVETCIWIRRQLAVLIPYDARFYLFGFIALFYTSFSYHALKTPEAFRKLFLSSLFLQGLGAIMYVAFPAVGPFIYEAGASPTATQDQWAMLDVHRSVLAGGRGWLAEHAGSALTTGLGAMPSLHVGGSFLFLWFAARHARVLLPSYAPIFLFILVTSVANRWHYVIDLPAGVGLALVSIYLAHALDRRPAASARPCAAAAPAAPAEVALGWVALAA